MNSPQQNTDSITEILREIGKIMSLIREVKTSTPNAIDKIEKLEASYATLAATYYRQVHGIDA